MLTTEEIIKRFTELITQGKLVYKGIALTSGIGKKIAVRISKGVIQAYSYNVSEVGKVDVLYDDNTKEYYCWQGINSVNNKSNNTPNLFRKNRIKTENKVYPIRVVNKYDEGVGEEFGGVLKWWEGWDDNVRELPNDNSDVYFISFYHPTNEFYIWTRLLENNIYILYKNTNMEVFREYILTDLSVDLSYIGWDTFLTESRENFYIDIDTDYNYSYSTEDSTDTETLEAPVLDYLTYYFGTALSLTVSSLSVPLITDSFGAIVFSGGGSAADLEYYTMARPYNILINGNAQTSISATKVSDPLGRFSLTFNYDYVSQGVAPEITQEVTSNISFTYRENLKVITGNSTEDIPITHTHIGNAIRTQDKAYSFPGYTVTRNDSLNYSYSVSPYTVTLDGVDYIHSYDETQVDNIEHITSDNQTYTRLNNLTINTSYYTFLLKGLNSLLFYKYNYQFSSSYTANYAATIADLSLDPNYWDNFRIYGMPTTGLVNLSPLATTLVTNYSINPYLFKKIQPYFTTNLLEVKIEKNSSYIPKTLMFSLNSSIYTLNGEDSFYFKLKSLNIDVESTSESTCTDVTILYSGSNPYSLISDENGEGLPKTFTITANGDISISQRYSLLNILGKECNLYYKANSTTLYKIPCLIADVAYIPNSGIKYGHLGVTYKDIKIEELKITLLIDDKELIDYFIDAEELLNNEGFLVSTDNYGLMVEVSSRNNTCYLSNDSLYYVRRVKAVESSQDQEEWGVVTLKFNTETLHFDDTSYIFPTTALEGEGYLVRVENASINYEEAEI